MKYNCTIFQSFVRVEMTRFRPTMVMGSTSLRLVRIVRLTDGGSRVPLARNPSSKLRGERVHSKAEAPRLLQNSFSVFIPRIETQGELLSSHCVLEVSPPLSSSGDGHRYKRLLHWTTRMNQFDYNTALRKEMTR